MSGAGRHFLVARGTRETLSESGYGADGELDELSALDRLWFRDHPGADSYFRAPHPVEVRQNRAVGLTVTKVYVERVSETVRVRRFRTVEGGWS